MKRKRFSEEQIIGVSNEAEQSGNTREVCRLHNISEQTFYGWRTKFGGMDVSEAKRPEELERENAELKKMVADLFARQSDAEGTELERTVSLAERRRAGDASVVALHEFNAGRHHDPPGRLHARVEFRIEVLNGRDKAVEPEAVEPRFDVELAAAVALRDALELLAASASGRESQHVFEGVAQHLLLLFHLGLRELLADLRRALQKVVIEAADQVALIRLDLLHATQTVAEDPRVVRHASPLLVKLPLNLSFSGPHSPLAPIAPPAGDHILVLLAPDQRPHAFHDPLDAGHASSSRFRWR